MSTPDFPATLAFDPENAVLAGAGNGWFAAIACDSTLHRGGVGAEIARRWNAHAAMLAFVERFVAKCPHYDPNGNGPGRPYYGAMVGNEPKDFDDARDLLALARGV